MIMDQYDGKLPASYEDLLKLPGVGPYTAGAIASIAYGLPEPAVDGNVLRVVARLTADRSDVTKDATKQRITQALRKIYPQSPPQASAMTQAIMELGERICLPNGAPKCEQCPLGAFCPSRAQGLTDRIPYRAPKKARKIQEKTIFLLLCEGKVALHKRKERGLLAGLWEFVNQESHLDDQEARTWLVSQGVDIVRHICLPEATHVFTHVEWHMKGYLIVCRETRMPGRGDDLVWVTAEELSNVYALPTAFRPYLQSLVDFWRDET